ncbi:MAG: hypothetical protein ACK4KT_03190, partial [Thermaurantimonas sp.]
MKLSCAHVLAFLLPAQFTVAQFTKTTFKLRIPDGVSIPADVRITGSAFGPNGQAMTATGGGVYEYELQSSCGKRVFYAFSINNLSESLQPGCCVSGSAQRFLVVPDTDTVLPTVCYSLCDSCESGVLVTFKLNLGSTVVSPQGVFIGGSFNNWSTTASQMVFDSVNGYYVFTTVLSPNNQVEYKFLNGSTFENVSGNCVTGSFNNRFLTIPASDTILPLVCFGSCDPCPAPPPPPVLRQVTFRVGMGSTAVFAGGVRLAGDFINWSPQPMNLDTANNLWTLTLPLAEGSAVEYKFVNDSVFESISGACASGPFGNRSLTVPTADTILPPVCFGSCSPCPAPPPPLVLRLVTFQVGMGSTTVFAGGVRLAGDFNNWSPQPMNLDTANNLWTLTLPLAEGSALEYKFVNDSVFESISGACASGPFGNRSLTVPTADTILPPVCFGSCDPCPAPPPPPVLRQVTFRVGMGSTTVLAGGVRLAGDFNNWSPQPMNLDTANNLWTLTLPLAEGSAVEYKFVNDSVFESISGACASGPFGNRSLTVPTADTILPAVCFGSCDPCPAPPPPPVLRQVTFRVNLGNIPANANGVHIAGSFNNWNPAATSMTLDTTTGFWVRTLPLPQGDSVQYKFINGNAWGQDETVPTACGFGSPANRLVVVPQTDTILPAVCFGSCDPCPAPPPPPVLRQVTFRVGMGSTAVFAGGVRLAGDFNNWSPQPMNLDTANNLWTLTLPLAEGSAVEYKFVNDSVFESISGACASGPFGNRSLTIPASDTILPPVCFGSCDPCPAPPPLPVLRQVTFRVGMGSTAVFAGGVRLAGDFINWSPQPMNLDTANNLWTLTLPLAEGSAVEYKFVNDSVFESISGACASGPFGNRSLTIPAGDTILPPVCFGSCDPCPAPPPPPVLRLVTFQVGMGSTTVFAGGVRLAGDFNNWSPQPMNLDTATNLWTLTLPLAEGSAVEYKFVNDSVFESISGACASGPFGNRSL